MEGSAFGRTILFADDSTSTLNTVQAILDNSNYQFHSATSGVEALCQIARQKPDMVFVDKACPRLNGFHICSLLKARDEYKDIPVILLSDKEDIFERAKAEVLGAERILVKPFSRDELLQIIKGGNQHVA